MRVFRWLAVMSFLVGIAGLLRFSLAVRSGALAARVGEDAFAHDAYFSATADAPFAGLACVGLILMALPGGRNPRP